MGCKGSKPVGRLDLVEEELKQRAWGISRTLCDHVVEGPYNELLLRRFLFKSLEPTIKIHPKFAKRVATLLSISQAILFTKLSEVWVEQMRDKMGDFSPVDSPSTSVSSLSLGSTTSGMATPPPPLSASDEVATSTLLAKVLHRTVKVAASAYPSSEISQIQTVIYHLQITPLPSLLYGLQGQQTPLPLSPIQLQVLEAGPRPLAPPPTSSWDRPSSLTR